MRLFTVINGNPYTFNEDRLPKKYPYDVKCAPITHYKYEVYVLCKKEKVSFEEVLSIFLKSTSKKNYLGAMSMIYWQYYEEIYTFLQSATQDEASKKKHRRAIRKFYKQYLSKWIAFIQYSDDTQYPQNRVFREMEKIIKEAYF